LDWVDEKPPSRQDAEPQSLNQKLSFQSSIHWLIVLNVLCVLAALRLGGFSSAQFI
jgi:hypothetical protein